MESKTVEFFNRLSFTILIGTIFLSLFFFIPYVPVTLDASKGFLVSVGVTFSLFFWLIARLGEGKFSFPRDRLILFAGLIPLVFLLSSFFSSSRYISFFGSGFEIGTFGSMIILFIIFFLSSIYFQVEKYTWYFYISLFIGAILLAIFELFNVFVGFGRFAPGLLQGISSGNLVGTWNDFALLFGLIVLLSIFTIEFLKSKKLFLFMQFFLLIIGMIFLIVINIPFIWLLTGLFSAIIFIYSISIQQAGVKIIHGGGEDKKFPFVALVVVFVSFIFLVGNNSIGSLISKYISVSNIDVRPSITATSQIALHAIKQNPFFGTGPNTFVIDWSLWKPKSIAQLIFWNVDFTNGFSTISTFIVTTGIFGLVAWVLFLFTFFVRAVKSIKVALQNSLSNYFIMMTLITSIYSWISLIFYTPNIVIIVLAFVSSGMLVGILVHNQALQVKYFSFLHDPRNSFFSILGLMVLMVTTLFTTYIYVEKFTSIVYFSKGSVSNGTLESLSKSEKMISSAILLDNNDIYYRTLSQVYIGEIMVLVNDNTISKDILKSNLQQLIGLAEQSASLAINQNPKQYLNYINIGNIYSSFVSLGVEKEKSYERAVSSYDKALSFAPSNPSILLSRASLEFTNKNNDEARKYIAQALDLKLNYTDALFLLSQIETSEGNTAEAIRQVERAGQLSPDDPTIFFRLGLLRYNNSDYNGAVSAFEKAVILDQNYFNARYFLGQSYQKVGRIKEASDQYEILNKIFPDNKDIKDAISSLSNVNSSASVDTTKATTKTTKTPLP